MKKATLISQTQVTAELPEGPYKVSIAATLNKAELTNILKQDVLSALSEKLKEDFLTTYYEEIKARIFSKVKLDDIDAAVDKKIDKLLTQKVKQAIDIQVREDYSDRWED